MTKSDPDREGIAGMFRVVDHDPKIQAWRFGVRQRLADDSPMEDVLAWLRMEGASRVETVAALHGQMSVIEAKQAIEGSATWAGAGPAFGKDDIDALERGDWS